MVFWAGNFVAVKAAIASVPPIGFQLLRFGLAAAILLPIVRWREGSVRWPAGTGRALFLMGAFGFGVYQVLWSTGLAQTTAGNSAILIASTPIFTVLVAVATRAERGHPARLIGALVAFGGVALVAGHDGLNLAGAGFGDLITVLAAALWGTYLALSARFLAVMSPLRLAAWAIVAGVAILAVPGGVQLASAGPAWVTPAALAAIAYSALLAAALAQVILFRAVALLGPTRIANLQFLVPALTVGLAAVVLGEPVLPIQLAGGALVVAGIVVARRAPSGAAAGRRGPEPLPFVEA